MTRDSILAYLRQLGLSQVRAAALLGVSDRQMRRWVSGKTPAPLWLEYALKGLLSEQHARKAPVVLPSAQASAKPEGRR